MHVQYYFLQVKIVTSDEEQLPKLVETYKLIMSQLMYKVYTIVVNCQHVTPLVVSSTQWGQDGVTYTTRE